MSVAPDPGRSRAPREAEREHRGIVRPMLASTEPSRMFTERCFRRERCAHRGERFGATGSAPSEEAGELGGARST